MSNLTVIFDMDGVILDSERVYQEIERSMYDEFNIPVSKEEHMSYMGTAERFMWKSISEKYKVERTVEDLVREERKRFLASLDSPGIPLMEGLIPLLETLKSNHIPCWIASSSSSDIIERVIEINGLRGYFRGFVSGEDVTESKPSPEIFLKTAELASSDPSQCIVIEDSPNGVKAALAAGMEVIILKHPESETPNPAGTGTIIHNLGDIDTAELLRRDLPQY